MQYKLVGFALTAWTLFYLDSVHEVFSWLTATVGSVLVILSLSWTIGSFLARYLVHKRLPRIDPNNKAILITGCDSGFGQLFALRLNEYGFDVFAGCLFPEGDGAASLQKAAKFPERMTIVALDVTSDTSVQGAHRVVRELLDTKLSVGLYGLVNNAGIARCAEVEWGTFDHEYRAPLDVNALGPVRVARAFLPLLRKAGLEGGDGRIVNIASIAGRLPFPLFTSYCMSKHALVAFSDGLRREMDKFDVKVISVEPFVYKTPMIVEGLTASLHNSWTNTRTELKLDYGQSYFKAVSWYVGAFLTYYNPLMVSSKTDEVVQSVEEALTLTKPEHTYVNCNRLLWPCFWLFINAIPTDIFELYSKYYTYVFKYMMVFFKQ